MLSNLLKQGEVAKARSQSLVNVDGTSLGHTGFLAVNSSSGKRTNQMFMWFQPCTDCDPATAPFIHWFNGGPGSPDTVGVLNQIGTHYVDASQTLHERCFSWCRTSNCLFFDSPVGTGFSFQTDHDGAIVKPADVEYTSTSAEATAQVLEALKQFYSIWPEYVESRYYVHGLSYGGHYVPHMAHTVRAHNRGGGIPRINLHGLAVGDPILDAKYQYPTVAPTLTAFGLVDEREAGIIDAIMANASALNDHDCVASFNEWNRVFNDDGGSSCAPHCEFLFEAYTGSSYTEHVLLGAPPASMSHFRPWLTNHAPSLHAAHTPGANASFAEGGAVYAAMVASGDFCESTARLYADLLLAADDPIDVLVYAGNLDPLLGASQAAAGVHAIFDEAAAHVAGGGAAARDAFYAAKKVVWRVGKDDDAPAGYARCLEQRHARFCHVVLRNSGHEAPSYQPRATYDLSGRFISRRAWDGPGPPRRRSCHSARRAAARNHSPGPRFRRARSDWRHVVITL